MMDSDSAINKIPLIRRILLFENKNRSIARVVELAAVSVPFADAIVNYPIWHDLFPATVARRSKLKDCLARASLIGDLWLVKSLLDGGCGLDGSSFSLTGGSPLHLAVNADHREVVELLLARGADIEEDDLGGRTVLHLARSTEMMRLLIAHGADVFATDVSLLTPLHFAASWCCVDRCQILLEKMAQLQIDPMPCPEMARRKWTHLSQDELENTYLYDGGKLNSATRTVFFHACGSGSVDVVKLILSFSRDKFYALECVKVAANSGHLGIVQELLRDGGGPPIPPGWRRVSGPYAKETHWIEFVIAECSEVSNQRMGNSKSADCVPFLLDEMKRRRIPVVSSKLIRNFSN